MAVRWPADREEPVADLRLPDGETLAARALPGPKPGWRLLILPAREAGPPPPLATAAVIGRPAESTVDTQDLAHRALQASLAQALERRQLEVHVAPEWRLGTSRPAAEALLRWRHPELGLIPCGHLLPVLRQGDLLRGFGAWTLAQACAQAARWAAQGRSLPLVVNVALEQLIDPAFPGQLREILAATGLDHVALDVRDVARSREFYKEHLGLEVIRDGGEENCFLGRCDGFFLTLFRGEQPGLNHYCYAIRDFDVARAEEKLKAAGLKPRRQGGRIYFDDPDGIEVQVSG